VLLAFLQFRINSRANCSTRFFGYRENHLLYNYRFRKHSCKCMAWIVYFSINPLASGRILDRPDSRLVSHMIEDMPFVDCRRRITACPPNQCCAGASYNRPHWHRRCVVQASRYFNLTVAPQPELRESKFPPNRCGYISAPCPGF